MTEQVENQKSTQQIIVIFLVVIAVLLAALVVVIVMQKSKTPNAASTAATTPAASSAQAPAGMGSGTAAEVEFDAKTATKVPAGTEPLAFVKAYHEAVQAEKWDAAFKMLPLAKQQSYGTAKAYGEQVAAYGITSYKLGKPVTEGDTVTIAAEQVTPQMPITYTWTFKKVGGQWYCASRDMGGTVQ